MSSRLIPNFFKSNFNNDIYLNVISKTFPLLQSSHKKLLLDYLVTTLDVIARSFNFDINRTNIYEHQFKQNNYQDLVALLLLLVPFINDDTNTIKQTITSLNDIYVAKKNPYVDINKDEPQYLYSNLQYGRCKRIPNNTQEIQYKEEYLDHNFFLLLNTIRSISNKLYINWIDILPYDIITYKSTALYIKTREIYEKGQLEYWDPIKSNNDKINGLCVDDIYDTIHNELFLKIYKIKWLIYDVMPLYPHITQPLPMLIACSYIFDMDMIGNDIEWEQLDDDSKKSFTDDWKDFVTTIVKKYNYITNVVEYSNSSLQKIGRSMLYFFDKDYKYKQLAIDRKEYIPFSDNNNIDPDDLEDELDDRGKNINMNKKEKKSLRTLHSKHMYEYIRSSIKKFKNTWYSKYVYGDENKIIRSIHEYKELSSIKLDNMTVYLTLKNIYNYSKSVTHFTVTESRKKGDLYPAFPRYWRSMDKTQKNIVLNRLNNTSPDNWFNISRYIKMTYAVQNIQEVNDQIRALVRTNLIEYIFESLIMRGVLSYFEPYKNITDDSIVTQNKNKYIEQILKQTTLKKGNKFWNGSYYYLTGKLYSQMDPIQLDSSSLGAAVIDYFEYNAKNQWFTAYAMNWISQINFFHKFYNNRVIFVTGSTGVGKSTQVPKLLLYALQAIDYKDTGSIACTQPRRTPTEKNAETVSSQLGVSVKDKKYYYIQFKHKNKNYTQDVDYLSLKFLTDGSLLQEIQNPVLKTMTSTDKTKNIKNYTLHNQYDIVIIDEAHEHNKNMDIILTLMRSVAYYNNDIRLVIVSATMDDDEPVYRRYYRDINDNRLYPLNQHIAENKLDRINVDRRLHISPPGQTTKHKITEYYRPTDDPIDTINNIVTQDPTGHILYFQPGVQEINDAIEKLNKILPPNVIVVPFHSKLNEFQRTIVENINDQLRNIKIDRNIPFSEFDESTNRQGKSHYNRAVIVATNIAEASLTIGNLKYVIETGTQKTAIYDFSKGGTTLVQKTISDSSRLQRKGRVGRTSSGTVYYMYPEGTTKGIKTQYDIVISNIYLELYDRLYDSYLEVPIFTELNDPNRLGIHLEINMLESLYDTGAVIKGLSNIIENQYFIDQKFYNYMGNYDHYDYMNSDQYFFKLSYVYPSGFSLDTLTDNTGKFYIVHPEELYIKRNILGEIVGLEPNADHIRYIDKRIISEKMISFWKILLDGLFMSYYRLNGKKYVIKTDFGKGISIVKQELSAISIEEFDTRFLYTLLYGMCLGVGEEIIRLISMYMVTMSDFITKAVSGTMVNGKFRRNIEAIQKYVGRQKSDSDAVIYILNEFHLMLENNNIFNHSISDRDNEKIINEIKELKLTISNEEKLALLKKYNNFALLDEEINYIITNETIIRGQTMTEYYYKLRKNIIMKSIMNNDIIIKWAQDRSIKQDIMKMYLDRYLTLKNIIYSNEAGLSKSFYKYKISDLVSILSTTIDGYIDDQNLITLSIMYGFKTQIVKKMIDNNYLSIYEPTIENIFNLKKVSYIWNTMVNRIYLQNYVLYLLEDSEDNTIWGLHYVDLNLMKYIGYIYSQDRVFEKCNKYLTSNIKYEPKLNDISINAVSLYSKTLNEIIYDLTGSRSHDVNIWLKLINIFTDKKYLLIRKYHDENFRKLEAFSLSDDQFIKPQSGGYNISKICEYKIDMKLLEYLLKKFENI